jgi:hypothetical protein
VMPALDVKSHSDTALYCNCLRIQSDWRVTLSAMLYASRFGKIYVCLLSSFTFLLGLGPP